MAAYAVGDANMGVGFFTASAAPERSLANTASYPADQGEVHSEGMIIGGAFWDLRVALIVRYGAIKGAYTAERLFFGHLLTTDTYRDSYDAVLRLDDDDANPATPAPDACLINAAFAKYGLAQATAGCVDDPEGFGYKADDTIVAGILDRGPEDLRLMASAGPSTRTMRVCFASAEACPGTRGSDWLDLRLDGTIGEKMAFVSPATLAILPGTVVWLAAFDEADGLVGRRAVKLITR